MALNANALTTLAMAKIYLRIPVLETSQDFLIELLINSSSQAIEQECNRVLKNRPAPLVEYHHGRRSNLILLREFPIISITELRFDALSVFTDPSTLVDPATYSLADDDMSIIRKNGFFPDGTKNIKVTYDAGYVTIPSDLEHACLWMVTWYYKIRISEDIGRTSKSKEGESLSYSQEMPNDIRECILRYKRTEMPISGSPIKNL